MQTKPKSNSTITHDVAGQTIIFRVHGATQVAEDGKETKPLVGELRLDMQRLHAAVTARAAIHGMIQRVSDAAAISRDEESGKPATPEEKLGAMRELVEHYMSGTAEWRRTGTSEGSYLLQALCVLKPDKTREQVAEWLKKLSRAQRSALSAQTAVAAEIQKIRAAAGTAVDGDELLAGL